ncbi:amino acid ABC transporter permease [Pseudonocardiaceae bacterium YIM PH 21723]|nr:amino acid ABC transporter permease [Pseudonocardiaceae bacterium YIM PH 21723]
MEILIEHLGDFGDGLLLTVELAALALVGALVIGVLVAALRVSPVPVLRAAGTAYVQILQNVPLLVWLVLAVFALPDIGVLADLFTTSAVVLALYQGAYMAEAVRSGINAVPVGQGEAARALGLTFSQSLLNVVLPQALRTVVQPLGTLAIMTIMNTAMAAAVGVVELTATANRVNLAEAQPIWIFVSAGLLYMALSVVVGLVTGATERKAAILR